MDGTTRVDDNTPLDHVRTRRRFDERNHGPRHYIDLAYDAGCFLPRAQKAGEEPISAAVAVALKYFTPGIGLLKHNGTFGPEAKKLCLSHAAISEFRQRTGKAKRGALASFMSLLKAAEDQGLISYQVGKSHEPAGYVFAQK